MFSLCLGLGRKGLRKLATSCFLNEYGHELCSLNHVFLVKQFLILVFVHRCQLFKNLNCVIHSIKFIVTKTTTPLNAKKKYLDIYASQSHASDARVGNWAFPGKNKNRVSFNKRPGAYLISWLKGVVLNRGRYIKEGGAFFKLGWIIYMKFRNFVIFASQIKINKYSCSGPPTFKSGSCRLRFS